MRDRHRAERCPAKRSSPFPKPSIGSTIPVIVQTEKYPKYSAFVAIISRISPIDIVEDAAERRPVGSFLQADLERD
jgi:hypothetical protein